MTFENNGNDTVSISNVVPFGEDSSSVYITGKGPIGSGTGMVIPSWFSTCQSYSS